MSNPTPSFQPQDPHTNQPHQGQQSFGQQSSGSGTGSIEIPGKGTRTLASVGQRALARIIDGLIAGAAGGIIGAILGVIIFAAAASGSETGSILTFGVSFVVILLIAIIGLAYETLMLTFYGATLGKMVMKIKVVSVETGENPQLLNALLRFALPGVMGLIPIVGGLAALACWLSPLFDSSGRQQGWHDKIAKTVVIANS
ncbi:MULTISPECIES: RDD family protein [Dermabacter]|uniref:RDD domain-containing protein n=1 Tax=Dermabacter hominis 1368 TaxID=1450519 RepID=A0ABR4SMY2_9MICO|nr:MULTISPECIES: RDD family protein [Dermabacter]EPH18223.1 hypothetical protein HMPREF1484_00080 [Dermabacter sp. HFH0086]KDS94032.1 hypothetical protein DHOM_02030 [Dermabacter hominis 1368]MDU4923779.1 RDD family protein [Dermabacter sp.]WIK60460.1 RDD family protein [Dermabacter hominis]